jgi:hypothetical protein
MATEIASRLWRRRYRVDDSGISEFLWDETPLRFIQWDELAQVHPSSLRSSSGDRIRPRLELDKKRCLLRTVVCEWRLRVPDAWREDNARRFRLCRRTTFIYLPLGFAIPLLLSYLLPWVAGGQGPRPAELAKLNRLSIMSVVCLGATWFYYFRWARHDYADA